MNFLEKIKLINKISKAYKQSKKVIDAHEVDVNEVKKALATLQTDLYSLSIVLPCCKEVYNEIKAIISDVF